VTFNSAFKRVTGQLHIGFALSKSPLAGLDMTEALRAAIVMGVSAVDSYIHNLCVESIVDSFLNLRPRTTSSGQIKIRIIEAERGFNSGSSDWLESEIRQYLARKTFQRAEDIGDALRFVDDRPKKWVRISRKIGTSAPQTKQRLNSIVDRRNMIVHEADIDPAWQHPRPLTPQEADQAVNFLADLVNAIDSECW